jgi:hypothetical protein
MKYIKLFEEMNITDKEFPFDGHDLSFREKKILTDLVGEEYLNDNFYIKVEDHYYYTRSYRFNNFNELKDYILSWYYLDNDKDEEYIELLKKNKLDPSLDRNRAIWWASLRGRIELVKHLLNDPRVDPSDDGNCSIQWAFDDERYDVVEILLNDKRVRDKLSEWEINKYTKYTL